jgi:hypothetical protein
MRTMEKRIVAYSFLAQINNKNSREATLESVFVPFVKRAIAKMCNMGIRKGTDISEIVQFLGQLYDLDMPLSVLQRILKKIEKEAKDSGAKVVFYSDWSFIIADYYFEDYEEEIIHREKQLERLQELFEDFLRTENIEISTKNIFHFVEQGKASLGKYIKGKYPPENSGNYTIEAKFIKFIQPIAGLYELVQSIYIGSVISTYLEYEPVAVNREVELVFDTNFVISLLDLNTFVSTKNCRRLLQISGKLGYKFTVLDITLRELDKLLKTRVEHFDENFMLSQIDPEDIYNACKRRNLTRTDLDKIRVDLTKELSNFGVEIVTDTKKYENTARFGDDYERLKEKRNTEFAALHDATCIEYIRAKRGKPLRNFDRVNCWFLNNSSSRSSIMPTGSQPYYIKSEDLLNLLWLSTPMVKNQLNLTEFADIGLSRLVTATLDNSLPKASTIKEFEDNIKKYAKDSITDEDIVRVAKSVAERTITNLESLNELASNDSKAFIDRLNKIAAREHHREEEMKKIIDHTLTSVKQQSKRHESDRKQLMTEKSLLKSYADKSRNQYEDTVILNADLSQQNRQLKKQLIDEKNARRKEKREMYISQKLTKWRRKYLLYIFITLVVLVLAYITISGVHEWDFSYIFNTTKLTVTDSAISILFLGVPILLTAYLIPVYRDRMHNATTIEKYKNSLKIPEEMIELPYDDE